VALGNGGAQGGLSLGVVGRTLRVACFFLLRAAMQPLRLALANQAFIGGASPSFADYIVFAGIQWARCGAGRLLLAEEDAFHSWFERLLDMYNGLQASAVCGLTCPSPHLGTQRD
jgi:hypothetical protein